MTQIPTINFEGLSYSELASRLDTCELLGFSYQDLLTDLQRDLLLGIDGMPVQNAKPADGSVLVWKQSKGAWIPTDTSGITGTWTAFTPVATAAAGAITSYTATGNYQKVNSQLSAFQFSVSLTNIGTASSDMFIALPSNFSATGLSTCITRETAITGATAFCYHQGGGHILDMYSTFLTSSSTIWVNNYSWAGLVLIPGTWS